MDADTPVVPSPEGADIVDRLNAACVGHPHARIPWPHRLLHDAVDEIYALRARVAALEAERGGWRDISTAPTNTSVLIYVPNAEHYGPGIYRAILVETDYGRRWHTTGLHVGRDAGDPWLPTHWRPLPAPPGLAARGVAEGEIEHG